MKECLRRRGLDVRQARRMVQDRSEWQGFVRECTGHGPGDEPLTLTRSNSYMKPVKVGSLFVVELTT